MAGRRTVVIVANTAAYVANMWGLLVRRLVSDPTIKVVVATPADSYVEDIRDMGAEVVHLRVPGGVPSVIKTLVSVYEIARIQRHYQPNIAHHFTLESIIAGGLAARLTGVDYVISSVAGLGYIFSSESLMKRVTQKAVMSLMSFALNRNGTKITCQNPDDARYLVDQGVVSQSSLTVIRSSGVDLNRFQYSRSPPAPPLKVLCATRLLYSKGVLTFIKMGEYLADKDDGLDATIELMLAANRQPEHPDAIPEEVVEEHDNKWPWFTYLGYCSDMPTVISNVHIVVHPTDYREGVPSILLEAAAVGRPLVASDLPGCREICIPDKTGYLVPPSSVAKFGEAVLRLTDSTRRSEFGRRARRLVEEEFGRETVVEKYMDLYRELLQ